MSKRRLWFAGLAIALLAACVGVPFKSSSVDFVPEVVGSHKFRWLGRSTHAGAIFEKYSSTEPFAEIRSAALREFAEKGYAVEENGSVVFHRGSQIKAVLLKGMRYDATGNLKPDPRATSMWTAVPTDFWSRVRLRFDITWF